MLRSKKERPSTIFCDEFVPGTYFREQNHGRWALLFYNVLEGDETVAGAGGCAIHIIHAFNITRCYLSIEGFSGWMSYDSVFIGIFNLVSALCRRRRTRRTGGARSYQAS